MTSLMNNQSFISCHLIISKERKKRQSLSKFVISDRIFLLPIRITRRGKVLYSDKFFLSCCQYKKFKDIRKTKRQNSYKRVIFKDFLLTLIVKGTSLDGAHGIRVLDLPGTKEGTGGSLRLSKIIPKMTKITNIMKLFTPFNTKYVRGLYFWQYLKKQNWQF